MVLKNIAIYTPTLGGGGAERTAVLLANALVEKGHKVNLLVADLSEHKGKLVSELKSGVNLVNFNSSRVLMSIPKLCGWIKKNKPTTIISSQTHANIAVAFAAKLSKFEGKLILREVSTPSINLKKVQGFKLLLLKRLVSWAYTNCSVVVPVSYGVKEDLENFLEIKLQNAEVIYDPVINDEMFKLAKEPITHKWFAKDRKNPVILAVGRLTEAKNYELLIHSFKLVVQEVDANLIILGEGEDRAKLEKLIKELNLQNKVDLYGFEQNPFKYMANCDLYVMSSKWEGLPGALIQALALGAKIVSTDCPSGPREILKNGQYGELVALDENLLINLCQKMLSSLGSSASFSRYFDYYHMDKVVSEYSRVIE